MAADPAAPRRRVRRRSRRSAGWRRRSRRPSGRLRRPSAAQGQDRSPWKMWPPGMPTLSSMSSGVFASMHRAPVASRAMHGSSGSARYVSRPASTRRTASSRAAGVVAGEQPGREVQAEDRERVVAARDQVADQDRRVGQRVAVHLGRRHRWQHAAAASSYAVWSWRVALVDVERAGERLRGSSPERSRGSRDSSRFTLSCEPSGRSAAGSPRSAGQRRPARRWRARRSTRRSVRRRHPSRSRTRRSPSASTAVTEAPVTQRRAGRAGGRRRGRR